MFTIPDPLRVAEGTYLVRPLVQQPADAQGGRVALHLSSMVVVGAEPILVDTGAAALREHWIEQTFGLVDPCDVRWIFLSHADPDHVGNLSVALEMCPTATVVTTWPSHHPACASIDVPSDRRRHLGDGDVLDLADRRLVAVRPPVFDSPTTCGLYDASTGAYWAADAFGAPVPSLVDDVDDLPRDVWLDAADEYAVTVSPWALVADPRQFGRWVDRVARLTPDVIAGAHGPLVRGTAIDAIVDRIRRLPSLCRSDDAARGAVALDPAG